MARFAYRLSLVLLVVFVGAVLWLQLAPPALLRVGAAYAAKIVCSNVFLAGRDTDQVLAVDVQAPGNPLLHLMWVDVDRDAHTVRAGFFRYFGQGVAVLREGRGCTVVPPGTTLVPSDPPPPLPALPTDTPWPNGEGPAEADPRLDAILDDPGLTGPGMRAVIVVHDGRLVGERYGEGFSAATPLIGWSMTKTVNAALAGIATGEGLFDQNLADLFPGWTDGRAAITPGMLLGMESGLAFNEDYGTVSDVTRMLYLEPDMAAFAAAQPLMHPPGTSWSYSSGTSAMISRLWQDAVGSAAPNWPQERLFAPLGMASAVFELDASGTYVGASYLYATARDWARFAELVLQDGVWNGRQILPAGYVKWMVSSVTDSYGHGQIWLEGGGSQAGIPDDDVWMRGHDGQYIAIVPSRRLAVVRMGLTPDDRHYDPGPLVAAVIEALN